MPNVRRLLPSILNPSTNSDPRFRNCQAVSGCKDEERSNIDFENVRGRFDQSGNTQEGIFDCRNIGGRVATETEEQWKTAELTDHRACVDIGQWRNPMRNVAEHFDESAAETTGDQRAETRIVLHVDRHFGGV